MRWFVVVFDIIVFAVATFFIVLVLTIPDSIKNYLFIEMLVAIFLGLIPAIIANNKGRDFFIWHLYGWLLFLVALIHSLLMKENDVAKIKKGMKKCRYCGEFIKNEAVVCRYCGRDIYKSGNS